MTDETTAATEAPAEVVTEVAPAAETAAATEEVTTSEAETKAPEAGSEAEAEVKVEGAPEEYAEFTLPEGIALDPTLTDDFKTVAKELNLNQDQAQKVVELGAKMRQADAEALVTARAEWVRESTDKFTPADLAVSKQAAETFGGEQFVTFLNESGLGNHPQVVGFLVNAGKTLKEDSVVTGGDRTDTPNQSHAEKLFGRRSN